MPDVPRTPVLDPPLLRRAVLESPDTPVTSATVSLRAVLDAPDSLAPSGAGRPSAPHAIPNPRSQEVPCTR